MFHFNFQFNFHSHFHRVLLSAISFSALLSSPSHGRVKIPEHPLTASIGSDLVVPATPEDRLDIIKRAQIYWPTRKANENLLDGPIQKKKGQKFAFNEVVNCKFVEPSDMEKPGGKTAKFKCERNGKRFKVKYSSSLDNNTGIWGEMLSTRLLWALGFPSDAMYAVRVNCENCPERPWRYITNYYEVENLKKLQETKTLNNFQQKNLEKMEKALAKMETTRATRLFNDAIIEIKFDADKVEKFDSQGWSFDELDLVGENLSDQQVSHEIKIQRDALNLLSALIQHADNKAQQQRILCLDERENKSMEKSHCEKPVLMIQDLGFTFGSGWIFTGFDPANKTRMIGSGTTADLKGFKENPLWSDKEKCLTQINYFRPTGIPANKSISQEGVDFLVQKLEAFVANEKDLEDLFKASRVEEIKGQTATLSDWTGAFKEKVQELKTVRCPSLK
jgi:hypothetical protein